MNYQSYRQVKNFTPSPQHSCSCNSIINPISCSFSSSSTPGVVPKPKGEMAEDRKVLGTQYNNGRIWTVWCHGEQSRPLIGHYPESIFSLFLILTPSRSHSRYDTRYHSPTRFSSLQRRTSVWPHGYQVWSKKVNGFFIYYYFLILSPAHLFHCVYVRVCPALFVILGPVSVVQLLIVIIKVSGTVHLPWITEARAVCRR